MTVPLRGLRGTCGSSLLQQPREPATVPVKQRLTLCDKHLNRKHFRWITAWGIKEEISLRFDHLLLIGQHGHKTFYLLLECFVNRFLDFNGAL